MGFESLSVLDSNQAYFVWLQMWGSPLGHVQVMNFLLPLNSKNSYQVLLDLTLFFRLPRNGIIVKIKVRSQNKIGIARKLGKLEWTKNKIP